MSKLCKIPLRFLSFTISNLLHPDIRSTDADVMRLSRSARLSNWLLKYAIFFTPVFVSGAERRSSVDIVHDVVHCYMIKIIRYERLAEGTHDVYEPRVSCHNQHASLEIKYVLSCWWCIQIC